MRRDGQRNTSDKKSAYAASISDISERDRANETKKFENRFGKIRDEEKMLVVKNLMHERLLNFRLRGTTLNNEELPNIVVDMVSAAPTTRQNKFDTSAPMEIGMAAKGDSGLSREERHHHIGCLRRNGQWQLASVVLVGREHEHCQEEITRKTNKN